MGERGNANARPFRKALRGFCTTCIVCLFLQDDMGFALPSDCDPAGLLLPHVQQQFAKVLAVGRSELMMDQIDWDEVVAKWTGVECTK